MKTITTELDTNRQLLNLRRVHLDPFAEAMAHKEDATATLALHIFDRIASAAGVIGNQFQYRGITFRRAGS